MLLHGTTDTRLPSMGSAMMTRELSAICCSSKLTNRKGSTWLPLIWMPCVNFVLAKSWVMPSGAPIAIKHLSPWMLSLPLYVSMHRESVTIAQGDKQENDAQQGAFLNLAEYMGSGDGF